MVPGEAGVEGTGVEPIPHKLRPISDELFRQLFAIEAAANIEATATDAQTATADSEGFAKSEEEFFGLSRFDAAHVANLEHELRIKALEVEKQTVALERDRLALEQFRAEITDRTYYGKKLFALCTGWLAVALLTVWASALDWTLRPVTFLVFTYFVPAPTDFTLSDAVLITLITTTTATVVGLFVLVVRYLFPTRDKSPG